MEFPKTVISLVLDHLRNKNIGGGQGEGRGRRKSIIKGTFPFFSSGRNLTMQETCLCSYVWGKKKQHRSDSGPTEIF